MGADGRPALSGVEGSVTMPACRLVLSGVEGAGGTSRGRRRRGHPARVSLRPFRGGPSGSRAIGTSKLVPFQRQSQQAQNPVTGPGGRAALGALEAVELGLGEVEQGGGLDERE